MYDWLTKGKRLLFSSLPIKRPTGGMCHCENQDLVGPNFEVDGVGKPFQKKAADFSLGPRHINHEISFWIICDSFPSLIQLGQKIVAQTWLLLVIPNRGFQGFSFSSAEETHIHDWRLFSRACRISAKASLQSRAE
jgi:hypothetical protein